MAAHIERQGPGPRERLVAGAIRLLQEHGYQAVGVQALCDVAGVQKGSFYHFFASKQDLALEALERAWQEFRSDVVTPALALPPLDRAAAIRRACGDHGGERPCGCLFLRLAASVGDSETVLQHRLAEIYREWAGLLGGGSDGWRSVAAIQGRMLIGLLIDEQVPT